MTRKILCAIFSLLLLKTGISQQTHSPRSLFNGKDLVGWQQVAGTADFKVDAGVIVGSTVPNSKNSFLITRQLFTNFSLELDVKIEDSTSNSGIQFRSEFDPAGNDGKGKVFGYQFELDPSSRKWTGGIYDEGRREWLYPLPLNPKSQKLLLTGIFNHIKVECVGHNIQTWVNGVPTAHVIDAMTARGFIALQVHAISKPEMAGKRIWWKNIMITELPDSPKAKPSDFPSSIYVVNTTPNDLSAFEKKAGYKLLFDGKTSTGWKGAYKKTFPDSGWAIKDGVISVLSSEGKESTNGGDIVTVDQYSAFDLSFEFLVTPGANSGVKYFVTLSENNPGSAIGLEYQVLDDSLHPDAKLGRDGDRTMASLYDLIKANKEKRFIHQPGEWNSGRIVVYPNNHVEHYLNGMKVLEYDRGSQAYRDLVALSKYKVWPGFGEAKEGHILLQDHGNAVSFRSIRIKSLR